MTSRERIKLAINHKQADRVPIDIGGTIFTGMHMDEYCDFAKKYSKGSLPPKVYEQYQMLARFSSEMKELVHGDVVELENPVGSWELSNENWKSWETFKGNEVLMPGGFNPVDEEAFIRLYDKKGKSVAYMPKGGLYFERDVAVTARVDIPLGNPKDFYNSLPVYTDAELRKIEERGRELYENTEYAIFGAFNRGQLSTFGLYAGYTITEWLILLLTEPDFTFEILSLHADRAIENLKLYLQAAGKYCDVICISGMDYGTQKSELFSPQVFYEQYTPNMKRINDCLHEHSDCKSFYHSCGAISNLIPHMIEGGVDILNPVQTSAAGMDAATLKEKFGDKIVFWGGGADTQQVLHKVSPEEVRLHVKERVEIFKKGGGYVFSQIHNLQYGVPPENIAAMVEAALEYGVY